MTIPVSMYSTYILIEITALNFISDIHVFTVDSTYNELAYKEFPLIMNHFQETRSGP